MSVLERNTCLFITEVRIRKEHMFIYNGTHITNWST